jgi:hypothetical protein
MVLASIPITSHQTNRSPVTPATDYKPLDQTKGITPRHMDNNPFTPQDHHPSDRSDAITAKCAYTTK